MALRDIFKVSRKTFFNPRAWLGYDAVKDSTLFSWDVLKTVFIAPEPEGEETFEQAIKRLNLNEADLQGTAQNFLIFSISFLVIGLFSVVAGFYLLFHHGTISGLLLAFAVTSLCLGQAFRYNFLFFQIKYRKLGCTFHEWWQGKPDAPQDKQDKNDKPDAGSPS